MANSREAASPFVRGQFVKAGDRSFSDAVKAAVDYRGDITVGLLDGASIEGYIFNTTVDRIDLFPKNSPRAVSIRMGDVDGLLFSGEDTANGKSYDDWLTKKEADKSAIKSQPIEMA
jgi:hypothetical protein